MPGQGRVVGLNVEFEISQQIILTQEIQACCRIRVVLVLGRLFRLGLNIKLTLETDLFLVIDRHV